MHLVEELTGVGKVYSNSELLKDSVSYEIDIWQEMLSQGPKGLQRTEIRLPQLTTLDVAELFDFKGLALEIENGRRFKFIFTSPDGTIALSA